MGLFYWIPRFGFTEIVFGQHLNFLRSLKR